MSDSSVGQSATSVGYADLRPGDVVEVRIDAPAFPQIDGEWERREVVAVADNGSVVRFRDGDREYDIEATLDSGRRMRRVLAEATTERAPEPPPSIILVWCPVCGRDDRIGWLNLPPYTHFSMGKDCPGKPIRVQYELVRQTPLRGRNV